MADVPVLDKKNIIYKNDRLRIEEFAWIGGTKYYKSMTSEGFRYVLLAALQMLFT